MKEAFRSFQQLYSLRHPLKNRVRFFADLIVTGRLQISHRAFYVAVTQYDCTVLRSTCFHNVHVANVARNLWSQNVSGLSFARFAIALQQSRKSYLRFAPGCREDQIAIAVSGFSLFRMAISDSGTGISRSL